MVVHTCSISFSYGGDVKKALLDKINLQTIDDIKKLAAKEIAKSSIFNVFILKQWPG